MPAEQISQKVTEIRDMFAIDSECSQEDINSAGQTSVALDRLVAERKLGSLAYYYMGSGIQENENILASIIVGNSLLTANHVPVAGEYEVKNAQVLSDSAPGYLKCFHIVEDE